MEPTIIEIGLIDTDILIDASRNVNQAVDFLNLQSSECEIRVSIITVMELIAGCRNSSELKHVNKFLSFIHAVPIDHSISHNAEQLMQQYFLSHGLLIPDALIAATSIEQNLTLYSRNTRHFKMIPQLNVKRPY